MVRFDLVRTKIRRILEFKWDNQEKNKVLVHLHIWLYISLHFYQLIINFRILPCTSSSLVSFRINWYLTSYNIGLSSNNLVVTSFYVLWLISKELYSQQILTKEYHLRYRFFLLHDLLGLIEEYEWSTFFLRAKFDS